MGQPEALDAGRFGVPRVVSGGLYKSGHRLDMLDRRPARAPQREDEFTLVGRGPRTSAIVKSQDTGGRTLGHPGGEAKDVRRIEPAAYCDRDRTPASKPPADRPLEESGKRVRIIAKTVQAHRMQTVEVEVGADRQSIFLEDRQMPRGQRADPAEKSSFARRERREIKDEVGQHFLVSGRLDAGIGKNCLGVGCEQERLCGQRITQRPNAKPVTRKYHPPRAAVEHAERKIAFDRRTKSLPNRSYAASAKCESGAAG